jgi:hypothetical protein
VLFACSRPFMRQVLRRLLVCHCSHNVCSSIDPVYVVPGAELGGDGRSGVEVEKVGDERQKRF